MILCMSLHISYLLAFTHDHEAAELQGAPLIYSPREWSYQKFSNTHL